MFLYDEPWGGQPQEIAEIGSDLTALRRFGVVGGFVAGGAWPPSSVFGRPWANVGEQALPVPVVAPFGLGARVTDAGVGRYFTTPTGSFSTRSFSFLTRVRGSELGVTMRLLPAGTGTSIFIWRNGTTFDMRINGTDYVGAGTFNLNQWYDIEIVGDADSCSLSVDGVLTISGAAAAAGTINGDVYFCDIGTTGQTNDFGYTLFCDRALSAAERIELRNNPWQLFAPTRIYIPTAVAADAALCLDGGALVNRPFAASDRRVYLTSTGALIAKAAGPAAGDRLVSMVAGQLRAV